MAAVVGMGEVECIEVIEFVLFLTFLPFFLSYFPLFFPISFIRSLLASPFNAELLDPPNNDDFNGSVPHHTALRCGLGLPLSQHIIIFSGFLRLEPHIPLTLCG